MKHATKALHHVLLVTQPLEGSFGSWQEHVTKQTGNTVQVQNGLAYPSYKTLKVSSTVGEKH